MTVNKITNETIEKEIHNLLEHGAFSYGNLDKFNILCTAMQNLGRIHYKFTEEDARAWVKSLNPPARWSMEQTTVVMSQNGYHHKPYEFWAVMNAMFSDYGKTMTKNNLDKPEVWAAMANDFLEDADAVPDKVGRYWRDIVMH